MQRLWMLDFEMIANGSDSEDRRDNVLVVMIYSFWAAAEFCVDFSVHFEEKMNRYFTQSGQTSKENLIHSI